MCVLGLKRSIFELYSHESIREVISDVVLNDSKRIMIIGSGGSSKSTLASSLSKLKIFLLFIWIKYIGIFKLFNHLIIRFLKSKKITVPIPRIIIIATTANKIFELVLAVDSFG